jgi:hypothetical protein
MTKETYTTPIVSEFGQVTARTLGGNRYSFEAVMKRP